mmetsp:Transcript_83473/g.232875  ORF Transcript_83473/g.232875 Transcript_83473/m.232875 type:complete len:118 (+) Transcript_83473:349-702(+)
MWFQPLAAVLSVCCNGSCRGRWHRSWRTLLLRGDALMLVWQQLRTPLRYWLTKSNMRSFSEKGHVALAADACAMQFFMVTLQMAARARAMVARWVVSSVPMCFYLHWRRLHNRMRFR